MGLKPCPDCAEQVQDAARVCRYCGHSFDVSVTRKPIERLRDSHPAWRVGGLLVYLALAWPWHEGVEGYSRAGNVAQGVALALTILAIVGTGFWLWARWKKRRKTWTRATLSLEAMLVALVVAILASVGRPEEATAAGIPVMTPAEDRWHTVPPVRFIGHCGKG